VLFSLVFSLLTIISNMGDSSLTYISGLEGSNYLALGRIAGTGMLICLFFHVMPSSRWIVAITGLSACMVLLMGVLVSGGRAPSIGLLLSILIVSLIMLFFQRGSVAVRQIKQKILLINALMIAGGAGLLYLYTDNLERIFNRLEILYTYGGGGPVSARLAMISSAIEAILSFPTIFIGLGIGGFSVHYSGMDVMRGTYPHNILLEAAVELGIFALIAIIAWLFYSLRAIFRMPEKECFYKMTFLALLFFEFFNAMISGDLNDNRLLFFGIGTVLGFKKLEMT